MFSFICGKCTSCGMLPSRIWQMFSELLNSLQYVANRLETPLYNTWLVWFNSAIRPVFYPQYEMFQSYFGLESPFTCSHLPWYCTLFFSAVTNICKRSNMCTKCFKITLELARKSFKEPRKILIVKSSKKSVTLFLKVLDLLYQSL